MSTIAQRLPPDRRFEFSSQACPSDTFAVVRMSGFEAISRPYRFELVLVSDDARIDLARVLAAKAELRILSPDHHGKATPYAGVLAEFDQLHQAGGFTFYRAVLVPRLWQLSLYRNSEVYLHEQTIPEIIEGLLKGAKLNPANDYTLKLKGNYRQRSYVCQYQETPLAFISRWLEREGIYYHFEQADGVERLVLLDDKVTQPAQAVAVNYRPADELDVGFAADSVQGFVCRTRPLPKTLVLQDYNHRRASVPLMAQAEVSASGLGEEMLYGENFRSEEEGQRYANLRAEELRCGGRVFSGEATAVGLRSGHFMDLSHHYRDDFNGRYLVTEITHEGSQAGALLAGLKTPFNEREGQTVYRNSFVALPEATQFRPARTTPKPRVAGTMSATVDAEGSGEYAELDEHGQYKVQIPFDRTEKGAAKGSAPVRMASPYAGSEHGMHFPLHKGTEVLLSFADGDPDQPVILGAVPNSVTPNVVDQRNPHDNLISTKGGNQMLMADTKGKEVIWLNSPFHKSSIGIGSVHPEGGGSIYEATTGGKDSVSFGHNNSMSFGSANALSLGTKASLSAAFTNDVSIGTKVGIDLSSNVSWKASIGKIGDASDGLMNVSIEDTAGVTLKKTFGGNSTDTAEIKAGSLQSEVTAIDLENSLIKLRAMIAGYTLLNFTQSTVFGMAVNASDNGALLEDKAIDHKKKRREQDEADLAFAQSEAEDKKKRKEALVPPEDLKTDAEKAAWKFRKEAEIDSEFKNRAAAQAAPSNVERKTLQGWPGIITKFGFDAVSNVTAVGLIQWYGRVLGAKIKALKLVSEMSLGTTGIKQTVNGDQAPAWNAAEAPGSLDLRTEFDMNPTSGVSLKVAAKSDNWADNNALTQGEIKFISNLISLNAGSALNARARAGHFGTVPTIQTDYAGMAFTSGPNPNNDSATLRTLGGAKVFAEGDKLELTAKTIELGLKLPVPDLNAVAAIAGEQAAEAALRAAKTAQAETSKAMSKCLARLALASGPQAKNLTLAAANFKLADDNAVQAVLAASKSLALAMERSANVANAPTRTLLHGLSVTQDQASLVFGAAGWKASHTGLAFNFGDAKADFLPMGITFDGVLIKLG